jgi:hypothetical protein
MSGMWSISYMLQRYVRREALDSKIFVVHTEDAKQQRTNTVSWICENTAVPAHKYFSEKQDIHGSGRNVFPTWVPGHKLNDKVSGKNIIYSSDSFILNEKKKYEKFKWHKHIGAEESEQPAMDHKPLNAGTKRCCEGILWDRACQKMMLCIVI